MQIDCYKYENISENVDEIFEVDIDLYTDELNGGNRMCEDGQGG